MHHFQQKCAHVCTFILQNGELWDMGHCGIFAHQATPIKSMHEADWLVDTIPVKVQLHTEMLHLSETTLQNRIAFVSELT